MSPQVRLYERTTAFPNSMENSIVSVSDTPLTPTAPALPQGTECGRLQNLQMEVTKDFIHSIKCSPAARGRYVQVWRNGEFFVLTEVEIYVQTDGEN